MLFSVRIVTSVLVVLAGATCAVGQYGGESETVRDRLLRLEDESRRLEDQLHSLRTRQETLLRLPPVHPVGGGADAGATMGEVQGEIKRLAWNKGDYTVTPYGRFIGSFVWETQRSYPGYIILWMNSFSDDAESASYFDARSTRVGLDIAGPTLRSCYGTKVSGRVEFDFQSTAAPRQNQGVVLFRRGYVEAKNEEHRVLFGQEWEVMSPLWPESLNYIPGSGAGNLGYRRAQLRYDRQFALSDRFLLVSQNSLNLGVNWDFDTDPTVIGQTAGWPVLEGRLAARLGDREGPDALPKELGFSWHLGEEIYDVLPTPNRPGRSNLARRTWSANLDVDFPITKRLRTKAELFYGENLAAYLGGILQGINPLTFDTIRSQGGWIDFGYYWTPQLHTHAGYTLDDPFDRDLASGQRKYNQQVFVNVIYDITKQWLFGVEVSSWKTLYMDKLPGEGVRFDIQTRYAF